MPAQMFIVCREKGEFTSTGVWVVNNLRKLFILEARYFSDISTEYEGWESNEGIK